MLAKTACPIGRAWGWIRLLAGKIGIATLLALMAFAPSAGAANMQRLPATGDAPEMLVVPPSDGVAGPHPVTVMLHGMCGAPENECSYFENAATRGTWLICPRATLKCPSGGSTWSFSRREETVEAAVARVAAAFPGRVDTDSNRTLIGFSLGAFVAMDLANRAPSRWSRVVLIGAKITPLVSHLSRGKTTFVLGAGELDLSYQHMRRTTRTLQAAGIDASFLSLGRVGHRFAEDMDGWVTRALTPFAPAIGLGLGSGSAGDRS
jgi:predicted esterase